LESGDLSVLPTGCYTVGFLKSYCRFLGLAHERYVVNYVSRSQTQSMVLWRRPRSGAPAESRLGDLAAWLVVCGLVMLGWITYAVVVRPQAQREDTRVEAQTLEVLPDDSAASGR